MLARQQRRQVHLIAQARCKHIQLLLRRIGSDEAHHCCLQPSHAFGLSIGLLEHAQEQVAQREHCEDKAPNQPAQQQHRAAEQACQPVSTVGCRDVWSEPSLLLCVHYHSTAAVACS